MRRGVVIQVSGGVDSAAAAVVVSRQWRGSPQVAHFVDYGQPYVEQERAAARYVATALWLRWHETTVTGLRLALSGGPAPKEYVPVRNAVLAMLSANVAASLDCDAVAVGNKTIEYRPTDPYSFRDCTRGFYERMTDAVVIGSEPGYEVRFVMPVAGWTKQKAVEALVDAGLSLEHLWWCYRADGATEPCGKCKHCEDVAEVIGQ